MKVKEASIRDILKTSYQTSLKDGINEEDLIKVIGNPNYNNSEWILLTDNDIAFTIYPFNNIYRIGAKNLYSALIIKENIEKEVAITN